MPFDIAQPFEVVDELSHRLGRHPCPRGQLAESQPVVVRQLFHDAPMRRADIGEARAHDELEDAMRQLVVGHLQEPRGGSVGNRD